MTNTENVRKPTKMPRIDMPCQPVVVWAYNFKRVALGYSLEQAQLEADRCLQCKNPRYHQGCPVEVHAPRFIAQAVKGGIAKAYRILGSTDSLPAVCDRVYPWESQRESKCILGIGGEPVTIGRLERFVADNAMHDPYVGVSDNDTCTVTNPDLKIACIGPGSSSTTVAGHLAARGIKITVFEALHEAGGALIYGIPAFRLPKDVVTVELDGLRQSSMEFRTNWVGDQMVSVQQLFDEGYKAVFIGMGVGLSQSLDISGENLIDVSSANKYLTRVNLERAYDFPNFNTPTYPDEHVTVFDAGNMTMDATRTALRLGTESSTIIYRRSRTGMLVRHEEVEYAEEEGTKLFGLAGSLYFNAGESGALKSVTSRRMALGGPDASGRRHSMPIEGEVFGHETDLAAVAVGTRSNPILPEATSGFKLNKRGYIVVNREAGETSIPNVFTGGDIMTGVATVISAMGVGRKAAQEIAKRLLG